MSSPGQAPRAQSSPGMMKLKAPYRPTSWQLGGMPDKTIDVPVTTVFLVLFMASAATHMAIFQLNRKHGRKFLISMLLFVFSIIRVIGCILRIASVCRMLDIPLAIAANVFIAAGVVIIFIINIIFTQRIVRATHPTIGWHKAFAIIIKAFIALIIIMIIILIAAALQSFYTLDSATRDICRRLQLVGLIYFAIVSFLPIPIVIYSLSVPRFHKLDQFGTGRWRTKIMILLTASFLVCFGACWRAACGLLPPRTIGLQPIYPAMGKAAFYIVNFTIEFVVLFMYAVLRVDKRFHVPNGSKNTYVDHGDLESNMKHKLSDDDDDSRAQSPVGGSMVRDSADVSKTFSAPESPVSDKFASATSILKRASSSLQVYTEETLDDDDLAVEDKRRSRRSSHMGRVRFESGDVEPKTPIMAARMAALARIHAEAMMAEETAATTAAEKGNAPETSEAIKVVKGVKHAEDVANTSEVNASLVAEGSPVAGDSK